MQGTAAPVEGLTALLMVVPGANDLSFSTPGAAALITTLLEKGASPDVQVEPVRNAQAPHDYRHRAAQRVLRKGSEKEARKRRMCVSWLHCIMSHLY